MIFFWFFIYKKILNELQRNPLYFLECEIVQCEPVATCDFLNSNQLKTCNIK